MTQRWQARRVDEGFTLVELLVVVAILPLIAGAIAAGFITTLMNKNDTQSRISDSHDAQLTSDYFVRDVQSADSVSTSGSSFCGKSSYLLGLGWTTLNSAGSPVTDNAVYSIGANGLLNRTVCGGTSGTTTLAHDWNPQTATDGSVTANVTVDCSDGSHTCADGKTISATAQASGDPSVNQIKLHVVESHTSYTFSVNASPNGWNVYGAGCASAGDCPGKPTAPPLHMIGSNGGINLGPNCTVTVTGTAATDNTNANSITGGTVTATQIYWPGTSGQPATDSSAPVVSGPPLSDPYSSLTPPAPGPGVTTISKSSDWPAVLNGIYYVNADVSINSALSDVSGGNTYPTLVYIAPGASLGMTGGGSLTIQKALSAYDPIVLWAGGTDPSKSQPVITLNGGSSLAGAIYAPKGTVLLNGGGATGQVSATNIDANALACNGGGASVGFGAGPVSTTTTAGASPNPVVDNNTVTLKAHVTAADGSTVNAGTVAFTVLDKNNSPVAACQTPVNVSAGDATCPTAPLSASLSQYKITASYQGTANWGPSTSDTYKETVLVPTATTVSTTATNLHSGDHATFMAAVHGKDGTTPSTGSVAFTVMDSANMLVATSPDQTLGSNGQASWTSGALLAGSAPYSVTATYCDSTTTADCTSASGVTSSTYATSTSPSLSVPVAVTNTTTTVVADKPSARPGATVTFTATVAPTPDAGSVSWSITGQAAPTCTKTTPLTNGQATCEVDGGWTLGQTYNVTATYSGDGSYNGSNGSAPETIAKVSTSTTGTVSSQKVKGVTSYQDVVIVTASDGSTPTGSVQFYQCGNLAQASGCDQTTGTLFDTETLSSNGMATSTAWANPPANKQHPYAAIYALYIGNTDYLSSHDGEYFQP